jgi:hypothetical protein
VKGIASILHEALGGEALKKTAEPGGRENPAMHIMIGTVLVSIAGNMDRPRHIVRALLWLVEAIPNRFQVNCSAVQHLIDDGTRQRSPCFDGICCKHIWKRGFMAIYIEGESLIRDSEPKRPARTKHLSNLSKPADKIRHVLRHVGRNDIVNTPAHRLQQRLRSHTASTETILLVSTFGSSAYFAFSSSVST